MPRRGRDQGFADCIVLYSLAKFTRCYGCASELRLHHEGFDRSATRKTVYSSRVLYPDRGGESERGGGVQLRPINPVPCQTTPRPAVYYPAVRSSPTP